MANIVRYTFHFAGQVQGVGFRYTTCRIAEDFDVCGYVENLVDGRVCVVAEGERAAVDAFLECLSSRMVQHIRSRQLQASEATGEYGEGRQFTIRS